MRMIVQLEASISLRLLCALIVELTRECPPYHHRVGYIEYASRRCLSDLAYCACAGSQEIGVPLLSSQRFTRAFIETSFLVHGNNVIATQHIIHSAWTALLLNYIAQTVVVDYRM